MMDQNENEALDLDLDAILKEFREENERLTMEPPSLERSAEDALPPENPSPVEDIPVPVSDEVTEGSFVSQVEAVVSQTPEPTAAESPLAAEEEALFVDSAEPSALSEPTAAGDDAPASEPGLEGNTVRFSPITEAQILESLGAIMEPSEEPAQEPAPQETPAVKPAFDVEEEFIPSPALFTSRSRLQELKQQLVAGPERLYYQLSETGTVKLQIAILFNLLIVLGCIAVTALISLDMIPENRLKLVIFSQILAMLLSALMGSQLMIDSVAALFKGRFTVNTLLTLTFFVCIADAVLCLKELRIPCCAAFSLEMTFALFARLQDRNTRLSQLDTLRRASRLHGLTRVKDYYAGKDGILRKIGEVNDYLDTYDKMSSPQVAQSVYAFISLLVCIGIFVYTQYQHGLSMGIQIFSTSLLIAVPASFFVAITRPTAVLEQRLHMVGTVLCGWKGVQGLCKKAAFPIYDQDLFPSGSTKLNGVKFYNDENPVDVVSYSASLINTAGGALVHVFEQLLANRNGTLCSVQNFQRYSGGGIGGEIHGVPVLLGSLNFLQDMGVDIPEGTTVNQAVYAAIDGQLSAVYAISYAKMRSATAGLVSLCSSRKNIPLLLCNDFMLTEDFLRAKFNVKTRRIVFPDQETAAAIRHIQPDPEEPCLALATREELIGSTYAVSGARALRTSVRLGVTIHILGGILGLLIMAALAVLGNTDLLTPSNVLLYQLIWAVPGLLVTEWTRIL